MCACVWQAYTTVNCKETGAGRHADRADRTCKNYTLCIYVQATDSYLSYNTACPGVTVFNPKVSKCTSPNTFECKYATSKPMPSHSPPQSVCTSEGYIADPNPTNCTSYLQCVEINDVYIEFKHNCPETTYFNPNTTLCESNYNCTDTIFTCSTAGRVADTNDMTCRRYYYCVALYNGTYAKFNYTCPGTTLFNPTSKLCTTRYECGY